MISLKTKNIKFIKRAERNALSNFFQTAARRPHTAQSKVLCGPVSFSLLCAYNKMTVLLIF